MELENSRQQLLSAVYEGNIEAVRRVTSDISLQTLASPLTAFHLLYIALKREHTELAKFFLTLHPEISNLSDLNTVLHLAIFHGDLELIKILLKKGITIHKEATQESSLWSFDFQQSPPYEEYSKIFNYLFDELLNINEKDPKTGYTLLHLAAEFGNVAIVALIVNKNPNLNVKSNNGLTPLHIAVMNGHLEIVSLLLEHGANHHLQNAELRSPLASATAKEDIPTIKVLLRHILRTWKLMPKTETLQQDDGLLIYSSVVVGNKAIIEELLSHSVAFVNYYCPETRKTPLHIAVEHQREDIVALLLQRGALANASVGASNLTSLHLAAKTGSLPVVKSILDSGCDFRLMLNPAGFRGYTPIHIAAEKGYKEVVQLFLEEGVSVNSKTKDGLEILHIAAQKGHKEIVQLLLKWGADHKAAAFSSLHTPLFFAAECGHSKIIEILSKAYSNRTTRRVEAYSSLYIAAYRGHENAVRSLLRNGADANFSFGKFLPPLHAAAQQGHYEIAKLLIAYSADVDPELETGNIFSTPLLAATRAEHEKIVELLLQHAANPRAKIHPITYCAHRLFVGGSYLDSEVSTSGSKIGYTPLHFAAELGNVVILKMLLQNGAEVNDKTEEGKSVLEVATTNKNSTVVDILINHTGLNITYNESNALLDLAIAESNTEILELILKKRANVDVNTEQDFPLHCAIEKENIDMVKKLIQYGANVNSVCNSGYTPLFHAVEKNNTVIFKFLLEKGALFESSKTLNRVSLLDLVSSNKINERMIRLLFHCGLSFNKKRESKLLYYILKKHDPSNRFGYNYQTEEISNFLFKLCLEHGGDPNVELETKEWTLLEYATKNKRANAVDILLKHDADLNAVDRKGRTPLRKSAQKLVLIIQRIWHARNEFRIDLNKCILNSLEYNDYQYDQYGTYHGFSMKDIGDPTPYRMIAQSLVKMIVRLQAADKEVSEENLYLVNVPFIKPYYTRCQEEIEKMKENYIVQNITFFQILVAEQKKIAGYTRNRDIVEISKCQKVFEQFPIYTKILVNSLQKGIEKNRLEEKNLNFFKKVLGFKVPMLIICEIFSYLRSVDLHNMITVWKPLNLRDDDLYFNEENYEI